MLVNENSEDFVRVDPSSGQEVLVNAPFSFNGSGFQIHIPQDAPWAGRVYDHMKAEFGSSPSARS